MINLLLLNNFYPMIHRRIEKESVELLYYGLVTRYGPQSVASASGQHFKLFAFIFDTYN